MLEDDSDDYSSGESSIDPSQLLKEMGPGLFGDLRECNAPIDKGPKSGEAVGDNGSRSDRLHRRYGDDKGGKGHLIIRNDDEGGGASCRKPNQDHGDSTERKADPIMMVGRSILGWKSQRKNSSFERKGTETIAIRHENKTAYPGGSKLSCSLSVAKVLSPKNDKLFEHSGKRVACDPSAAWVECIAIYEPKRKCYILEKVDWVSNLNRTRDVGDQEQPHRLGQGFRKHRGATAAPQKRSKSRP